MYPPSTGAPAGASDITRVSSASWAAARSPAAASRTIARPSTRPAQPPTDWMMRARISSAAEGASAVATPARVNSPSPASSTGRRPNRSEIGP